MRQRASRPRGALARGHVGGEGGHFRFRKAAGRRTAMAALSARAARGLLRRVPLGLGSAPRRCRYKEKWVSAGARGGRPPAAALPGFRQALSVA